LATLVGAGEESLLLGSKATKAALRLIPLEQYRIVAFATHALVPNTILGVSEPALALSPLKSLGECDENVLTSSDVATMRLNADWVILSACNTGAAPNQETDAEQLSGLAEAFFYAGSRSLLVSHWRVRSDMAAKLTTQTLQVLTEHPEIGRAAALQQATLAVINSGTYPHPANWAPFVVIGEGGAGR